jgi:hypothetical protein
MAALTVAGTYVAPATLYMALSTGAQVSLDGTLTNEVTGGGYAREVVTFDPAAAGECVTAATVDFDIATENWGTVSHFAICSGLTGNNVVAYGSFTASKAVSSGMSAQIRAGEESLTLV